MNSKAKVDWPFVVLLLVMFFIVVCPIVDLSTGKLDGGYAPIVDKNYTPAKDWTSIEYDPNLKIMVTRDHHSPEHWDIALIHKGQDVNIQVSHRYWNKCNVGEEIPIITRKGGFTGLPYGYRVQNGEAN